jgi:hypothetical protein
MDGGADTLARPDRATDPAKTKSVPLPPDEGVRGFPAGSRRPTPVTA